MNRTQMCFFRGKKEEEIYLGDQEEIPRGSGEGIIFPRKVCLLEVKGQKKKNPRASPQKEGIKKYILELPDHELKGGKPLGKPEREGGANSSHEKKWNRITHGGTEEKVIFSYRPGKRGNGVEGG